MEYYVVQIKLADGTHRFYLPNKEEDQMPVHIKEAYWCPNKIRAEILAAAYRGTVFTIKITEG